MRTGLILKETKTTVGGRIRKESERRSENPCVHQEAECPFCRQAREFAGEVGAFSNKIRVEVYDFVKDSEKAKEYQKDKVPRAQRSLGIYMQGV